MSYADFANAICHKTQKAAQAMIQARIVANAITAIATTSVFAGIQSSELTSTRVVCVCRNAVPAEPWEGNWLADLTIKVIAPFADYADADDFHELSGQIFAFFFQDKEDVATRLSNATVKYTAQLVVPKGSTWDIEAGADGQSSNWSSEMSFQVQCCGSVVD